MFGNFMLCMLGYVVLFRLEFQADQRFESLIRCDPLNW